MHQNSPFQVKIQFFGGRGHSPIPRLSVHPRPQPSAPHYKILDPPLATCFYCRTLDYNLKRRKLKVNSLECKYFASLSALNCWYVLNNSQVALFLLFCNIWRLRNDIAYLWECRSPFSITIFFLAQKFHERLSTIFWVGLILLTDKQTYKVKTFTFGKDNRCTTVWNAW